MQTPEAHYAESGELMFTDRGEHELKGIDEPWRVHALDKAQLQFR